MKRPNVHRRDISFQAINGGKRTISFISDTGPFADIDDVNALGAYTDQLEKEFEKLYTEHLATVAESLKRMNRIEELVRSNDFADFAIKELTKAHCTQVDKIGFLQSGFCNRVLAI